MSGAGPCAQAVALVGPQSLALSAGGNNAYVATAGFVNGLPPLFNDALVVFDRNPTTGELTQKPGTAGCITKGGTSGYPDYAPGACGDGVALVGPYRVSVSPDGRSAYVASIDSGVAVFDRNPTTGALTQKPGTAGCISNNGFGGACAEAVALDRPSAVTLSPDGKNAYVPSRLSDAVAVFDRDPTTGELTQKPGTAGCISEDGTSGFPDNTPGDCTDGVALDRPSSLAVSFDGKNAYVASEFDGGGAVAVFDRQAPGPPYGELGSATAKKTQKQKGKKIAVKVKVKANEDLTAKATGKVKVKKKSYKLKPRTRSVNSGQSTNLKLKPKKSKDVKKIAKALKRGKKATAKLTVKLTDEAGDNTKTNKLKVKLKR